MWCGNCRSLLLIVLFLQAWTTGMAENRRKREREVCPASEANRRSKVPAIQRPKAPAVQRSSANTLKISSCSYHQYDGLYYFGPIFKVYSNVEDFDQCLERCWKFAIGGIRRCLSINYLMSTKRCELMHQVFNVSDFVMAKYYSLRDPDALYVIPKNCPGEIIYEVVRPSYMRHFITLLEPPSNPASLKGTCGKTLVDPMAGSSMRIIGGQEARPGSIPWIVSIQNGYPTHGNEPRRRHQCGGTLIRVNDGDETDILVTAAHCACYE